MLWSEIKLRKYAAFCRFVTRPHRNLCFVQCLYIVCRWKKKTENNTPRRWCFFENIDFPWNTCTLNCETFFSLKILGWTTFRSNILFKARTIYFIYNLYFYKENFVIAVLIRHTITFLITLGFVLEILFLCLCVQLPNKMISLNNMPKKMTLHCDILVYIIWRLRSPCQNKNGD